MICSRCGTEHNDPDNICPRCYLGRPKEKIKLPKWAAWLIGVGTTLSVLAVATVMIMSVVRAQLKDRWLHGVWENKEMALIIDREDKSFQLINGGTVVIGKYELDDTELRLISEEGSHYVYFYELEDEKTLNISFADGVYYIRETLEKLEFEE